MYTLPTKPSSHPEFCKLNHILYALLYQFSLIQCCILWDSSMMLQIVIICSFSLLYSVLWAHHYLSILLLTGICFLFLTIMNSTTVNILVHIFCEYIYSFLLGIYQEVEFLIHRVSLALIGSTYSYPKWWNRYTFPSTMCKSSCCSTF